MKRYICVMEIAGQRKKEGKHRMEERHIQLQHFEATRKKIDLMGSWKNGYRPTKSEVVRDCQ